MSHRRTASRIAAVLAAGALSVLATAAPSLAAGQGPDVPVVEISVDSAGIHALDTIAPGVTTFHTTSSLPGTDSMAVVRLDDGVGYDEIFGYLANGDLPAVFARVSGKSGIAHAGPHNGGRWTTTLTTGNYLYVDDEAGLVQPFQVAGPRQQAQRPADDGVVMFGDGTFRLPACFGSGTWRLHNGDTISHGLGIVHVAPGHTRAEVSQAIADGDRPAWLEPQGTVNILGPGETAWVTLRDLHGLYVFVDYLPLIQGQSDGPVVQFRDIP